MKALTLSVFLVVAVVYGNRVDYTGHSVLRSSAADDTQLTHLRQLHANRQDLDFWVEPRKVGQPVDIHVQPDQLASLVGFLNAVGIEYHVKVADLGKALEEERLAIAARRELTKSLRAFDFENYHPYDEIRAYLEELAANSSLVTLDYIATTYENRGVAMVTISSGDGNGTRPLIFFDCSVHAREWAAGSTCLWFINELTTKYGTDSEVTQLLNAFDWKIIPVANPDGNVYTWTTDRLWRKNRRPGATCYGVDINRNFDVNWGGAGSSNLLCSETYHGTSNFSEPESSGIRDVLAANRPRVKAAISIHTYSQLWMSPYAYTNNVPAEYPEMLRVMTIGVQALEATYGTVYEFGNHADALYIASGATLDHAYAVEGAIYSYLIELRDTGAYGFELPPSQIAPTAIETWNGIKAMALAIAQTL